MITGFNTDIEHDGVVYHVQTEDKGLDTPIILSLVYVGGTILASKRAPYQDLITEGFSDELLAERLKRQHKLICAAIHSGRINDLKKMSTGPAKRRKPAVIQESQTVEEVPEVIENAPEIEAAKGFEVILQPEALNAVQVDQVAAANEIEATSEPEAFNPVQVEPEIEAPEGRLEIDVEEITTSEEFELAQSAPIEDIFEIAEVPSQVWSPPEKTAPLPPPEPEPEIVHVDTPGQVKVYTVHDSRNHSAVQESAIENGLNILLLDDAEFYSGEARTLRVLVVDRQGDDEEPLGSVAISIKILGTTFRPQIYSLKTDRDGVASVDTQIPLFTSGRAAVLVRAVVKDQAAELRRIIHPNR